MFITKMSLPRRTFLRGMGVTMALPLLESMVPAFTAVAQTAAVPPKRFGAVFVPLGERPGYWTPETAGSDFTFSPILKPLEPLRASVSVVSQLCVPQDGHATTVAAWLTGSVPKRTTADDHYAGISIDQLIARRIGEDTVFRSLELATEDFTGYVGGCDPAYACAYMNTLSWADPTTPLPMEINPRIVFERMFGMAGTAAQRLERLQRNRSILDSVTESTSRLQRNLGARDRGRFNEYLTHVREIEQRIQRAEKQSTTEVAVPDAPIGVPESFEEHVALQFDLLALALQTDLTRVFTFMMSRDASQRVYPNLDITEPHHALSHHGNDPEKIANLVKLNTWQVSLFGKFLEKLRATPDGDGTLLDHSLILYGSGMSESNTHSRLDIPTLLAGGQIKGNRHIKAEPETPGANLMLSLADKFGCEVEKFGISTGRVEI
jgi:hypothetical protein